MDYNYGSWYDLNQAGSVPARKGKGTEKYGPNYWSKTGHCRRCNNGEVHVYRRRGAGGEHPSGVILKRGGGIRYMWEDEIAPGEKRYLRRQVRAREKRFWKKDQDS